MSGHSKWSTIKRRKGAVDARKGKLFTRLVKEIIVAAREGGGDADSNPRLRLAIENARSANMPNTNIDRAIKRGTGEIDGVNYESLIYEGYGINGVAILVEALTDNKLRTVSEIRHVFNKFGGNLAESGSVAWMFVQKGLIEIPREDVDEDELMMNALDAGAEDIVTADDVYEIHTSYNDLHVIYNILSEAGYRIEKAELVRVPKNTVNADDFAESLFKLIDQLEDLDDVQRVYANYEFSDEVLERISED